MGQVQKEFNERYHHYIWIRHNKEYKMIPCYDCNSYSQVLIQEFGLYKKANKYKFVTKKRDPLSYIYQVNYDEIGKHDKKIIDSFHSLPINVINQVEVILLSSTLPKIGVIPSDMREHENGILNLR